MARWNIGAWTALALSMTLLACSSGRQRPAPVADWAKAKKAASAPASSEAPAKAASEVVAAEPPAVEAAPKRAPVGVENAGKPGYYTVQKGDTLIRIGLDAGQNYRDIARWNAIENPNKIEIGDVYRVVPPEEPPVVAKAVVSSRLSVTPLPPVLPPVPVASANPAKAAGPAVSASSPTGTAASAAVKAADPTATIIRAETDSSGHAFEAHVKEADGTVKTYYFTSTYQTDGSGTGFGPGGPGGPHGGPQDQGPRTEPRARRVPSTPAKTGRSEPPGRDQVSSLPLT